MLQGLMDHPPVQTPDAGTAPVLHMQVGGRETTSAALDWAFGLAGPGFRLFTTGLDRRAPSGPSATLKQRTRGFLAGLRDDVDPRVQPRLLVGALPFDPAEDDFLFSPVAASNEPWRAGDAAAGAAQGWRVTPEPDRAAYTAAVSRVLDLIAEGGAPDQALTKAVLARSLKLEATLDIDVFALWRGLKADPAAVRFLTPVGVGVEGGMRRLVGATPELLASRRGDLVASHPLAGSARRSPDIAEDEAAAKGLLASDKDQREHALVVEAILDALSPLCRDLSAPGEPALMSTRTLWHLGTRIEGRLRHPDDATAIELAALLHPTPAVGGAPRRRAMEVIRDLEPRDRGFYAGPVGWTNADGDGDWYLALRCAEVSGRTLRAFAGAGIVAGSDPEAEADETSAKLLAILRALGIDEAGQPQPEAA